MVAAGVREHKTGLAVVVAEHKSAAAAMDAEHMPAVAGIGVWAHSVATVPVGQAVDSWCSAVGEPVAVTAPVLVCSVVVDMVARLGVPRPGLGVVGSL
jgi:hypothetical protein